MRFCVNLMDFFYVIFFLHKNNVMLVIQTKLPFHTILNIRCFQDVYFANRLHSCLLKANCIIATHFHLLLSFLKEKLYLPGERFSHEAMLKSK